MELSPEDSLRLHVMINSVHAVRIDSETMEVHGLAADGDDVREARVRLSPNCRQEQYLKLVREFLSGIVLGSPGGYPLHLARWTRMGQRRDAGLDKLLLLGEPEAVTAVSGAPGLTDELARRVWWVAPTSEHARRMLEREPVRCGFMGPVLATHLVDYLPFETDARIIMETVRLIVRPGLITDHSRSLLWERGAKQAAYRVGFLQANPDDLPASAPARADLADHAQLLAPLAASDNPVARLVLRALSPPGQAFVSAAISILLKPADQDVVAAALDVVGSYFRVPGSPQPLVRDIAVIAQAARAYDAHAAAVIRAVPALQGDIPALLILGQITEAVVGDILAHTTASGTLLRRKLAPVLEVILQQLVMLRKAD